MCPGIHNKPRFTLKQHVIIILCPSHLSPLVLHPGIQQLTAGKTDASPEKSEEGGGGIFFFFKQMLSATDSCQWGNNSWVSIKSAAWWRRYFLPASKWGCHQMSPTNYSPTYPPGKRFCQGTALNQEVSEAGGNPAVVQTGLLRLGYSDRHTHPCRDPEGPAPHPLLLGETLGPLWIITSRELSLCPQAAASWLSCPPFITL